MLRLKGLILYGEKQIHEWDLTMQISTCTESKHPQFQEFPVSASHERYQGDSKMN